MTLKSLLPALVIATAASSLPSQHTAAQTHMTYARMKSMALNAPIATAKMARTNAARIDRIEGAGQHGLKNEGGTLEQEACGRRGGLPP